MTTLHQELSEIATTPQLERIAHELKLTQRHLKRNLEVLANFDFAHAQTSYDPATDKLYISKKTYEAIMTKTLVPNIPIENIQKYRVKKYLDRGFKWQDGISIPVL